MRSRLLAAFVLIGLVSIALLPRLRSEGRAIVVPNGNWTVVAWNDLGMHCMDSDYSVFSILPPFNTVQAQLIDDNGDLVTTPGGIVLTYEAVADPSNSINTTSIGKTNYWQHAGGLYGASPVPNTGLTGNDMPGAANTPRPMTFDGATSIWSAVGVPITPYDDLGRKRYYPLMRISARTGGGTVLASSDVVLPVSDEMDCRACHSSGSGVAAQPAAGWVFAADAERDYRLNILRLHDQLHLGQSTFDAALATKGYSPQGLEATVAAGSAILCAGCHASNALPGTGLAGVSALTAAVHAGHADVVDPMNGLTLDASTNRGGCYRCHPGSETRCLRGAMGSSVAADGSLAIQCQNCHGNMSAVGDPARVGWLEQPSCQNCHTGTALVNSGQIRFSHAFDATGALRVPANDTFATNAGAPAAGFDLYRFSTGHGGLACEACHGSTHAEYPGLHANDNLQSVAVQGHVGTIGDCTACHDQMPETETGGPHGMHPIGWDWVDHHHDAAENGGHQACRSCHGTDYRGTELSRAMGDRSLWTPFGTKDFWRGFEVGCYDCHDGPTDDDPNSNLPPFAVDGTLAAGAAPVSMPLVATDPNGDPLTLRIVRQPNFGTVSLSGATATYHPMPGFAGDDEFYFAARDGDTESNLGRITVHRAAEWGNAGYGYAGSTGVPTFTASAPPALGTSFSLQLGNSRGTPTQALIVWSTEYLVQSTPIGGSLLVRPDSAAVYNVAPAGLSIPLTLPIVPSLIGATVYLQAIEYDPGAAFSYSFSPALRLTIGT